MYKLRKEQKLPISIEEAWHFFSSPKNLKKITPSYMGFDIIDGAEYSMYQGMIIKYKVKPMLNIPLTWVTEITHVKAPFFFVDEQRVGPYAIWHHQHHFKSIPGGVEVVDIVNYLPPFGILGKLLHPFLIRPKLESIFEYRYHVLKEKFGELK